MKLDEYLFRNKMTATDMGKKIGMTSQTIRSAALGVNISFRTASKIVMATNHEVGFEELLPIQYISMISEYIRKNK